MSRFSYFHALSLADMMNHYFGSFLDIEIFNNDILCLKCLEEVDCDLVIADFGTVEKFGKEWIYVNAFNPLKDYERILYRIYKLSESNSKK